MRFPRRWMWQEKHPLLFQEGGCGIPSLSKKWAWHPHLTITYYTKQEYSTIFSAYYNMFLHPTINYYQYKRFYFMKVKVASPSLSRR